MSAIRPVTIIFGSNRFIGTNGIISVKGKQLFKIDWSNAQRPLITVDIRNKKNELLGKVWKSTSFVHHHEDYEPVYETEGSTVKRLSLRNKISCDIVFDLVFLPNNSLDITGVFYVKELPFPIIATHEYLDLNTNRFSRNTIMKNGTGILIDKEFIAI